MRKRPEEKFTIKDGRPENIISAVEALQRSNGWKIIVEVLTQNVSKIERAILESDESWTPQELTKWRDMRYFEKKLIQLPETIIQAYKIDPSATSSLELDPYKKTE